MIFIILVFMSYINVWECCNNSIFQFNDNKMYIEKWDQVLPIFSEKLFYLVNLAAQTDLVIWLIIA